MLQTAAIRIKEHKIKTYQSIYRYLRICLPITPLLLRGIFAAAQPIPHTGQPALGPGGADYAHLSVAFFDAASDADGYWLFIPQDPIPAEAEVVVFMHGYGAYNPMAYGKWIKHLVAKGNIVIYPRYQRNILWPKADKFPKNAAKGIRDAIAALGKNGLPTPLLDKVCYIGHSYGGVINSHLGTKWQKFGIPKPASMLLCEPGSGPLKGARLNDYSALPTDLQLLIVAGEDDYVVGDEFSRLVFHTAVNTPMRNFIMQRRTTNGHRWISATHSEPYCYDLDFDTGVRNYTAKRVLERSRLNEVDFNCYWKFADALMASTREGRYLEVAFGNTPEQRFLGYWPDGKPIISLEVLQPSTPSSIPEPAMSARQEQVGKIK
jgi:Chlorophyllase